MSEHEFSVRSFGAAGDGVADDTAAIQATLDAAGAAGGGVVLFPDGVYATGPLVVHDRTIVRGASPSAVIRARPGYPAARDTLFQGDRRFDAPPNEDIVFEYLTLDGNYREIGAEGPEYLILFSPGRRVSIRHCVLRDFYQYGIAILDNANPRATRVGSTDNEVVFNHIEGRLGDADTTSIAGVYVGSQLPYDRPPDYEANPALTQRTLVAFNTISGSRYAIDFYNAAHNRIIGNNCTDQSARNIICAWGSSYSTIANNTCRLSPGSAIGIGGDHIAVTGNVIEDVRPNRGGTGEGRAINGYGDWEHVTIAHNTIRRVPTGIFLGRGTRHATVVGNTVAEATVEGVSVEQDRIAPDWPPDRRNESIVLVGNVVQDAPLAFRIGRGPHATVRASDISLIGNMVGQGCARALSLEQVDQVLLQGNDWGGKPVTYEGNSTFRVAVTSSIDLIGSLLVQGRAVVGSRRTGWGWPVGSAQRGAFDADTINHRDLARRFKALLDDLMAHGLVGP